MLYIDKMGLVSKLAARGAIKEFELLYRKAQERGEIPPNLEIEKLLAVLEGKA